MSPDDLNSLSSIIQGLAIIFLAFSVVRLSKRLSNLEKQRIHLVVTGIEAHQQLDEQHDRLDGETSP